MRILIPGLLLCSLLSAADTVPHRGNYHQDWWRSGDKAPWSFGRLDEDGDGTVSSTELAKAQEAFLKALKETRSSLLDAVDVDRDGTLTQYESVAAHPRFASLRERGRAMAIAMHDRDADGKLSEDESKALTQVYAKLFVQYGAVTVDSDKDRRISADETRQAIAGILASDGSLFVLCDRNNDGKITTRETKLAFDLLAIAAGLNPLP